MDQRRPRHQKAQRISRIRAPALCPNSDHLHAPTLQDAPYHREWHQSSAFEETLPASLGSWHGKEQLEIQKEHEPSLNECEPTRCPDFWLKEVSATVQRLGPTHQQSQKTQGRRSGTAHDEHTRHIDVKRTEVPCKQDPAYGKPNTEAFRHPNRQSGERVLGDEVSSKTWRLAKPATRKVRDEPTFIPYGPRSRNAKLRGRSWKKRRARVTSS